MTPQFLQVTTREKRTSERSISLGYSLRLPCLAPITQESVLTCSISSPMSWHFHSFTVLLHLAAEAFAGILFLHWISRLKKFRCWAALNWNGSFSVHLQHLGNLSRARRHKQTRKQFIRLSLCSVVAQRLWDWNEQRKLQEDERGVGKGFTSIPITLSEDVKGKGSRKSYADEVTSCAESCLKDMERRMWGIVPLVPKRKRSPKNSKCDTKPERPGNIFIPLLGHIPWGITVQLVHPGTVWNSGSQVHRWIAQ